MALISTKISDFKNRKLSMVTCYDALSASILSETPIDLLLVGDSVAMVMHGYETTLNATIEMMEFHTASVKRGLKNASKILIADMPFMSVRKGLPAAIEAVERLMRAGAHAVKIEGLSGHAEIISHIIESGVPVIGHLGLTPQSIYSLGGFKVQGGDIDSAQKIFDQAVELEARGCEALVLECVPTDLAKKIAEKLEIPVIGIGAGPYVDGQVLVLHDLMGMNPGFKPKFVKTFAQGHKEMKNAVELYCKQVTQGEFPTLKESYNP